jgi:hypothetical protein
MTGRGATITSTDPHTGEPIRIRRHEGAWTWEPFIFAPLLNR